VGSNPTPPVGDKPRTVLEIQGGYLRFLKILKLLFQYAQLNTSDLAHRLGTNYASTLGDLSLLKKEGIVAERRSGKTRFFRFTKTLKAQAVVKLLEEWES
jgi:DNA-binding transcriptional ArsR family regulator